MEVGVMNAFWTFVANTAISYAVSSIATKLFGAKQNSNSPTYTLSTLQTQVNSSLVMPIVYGTVKCAGNEIWASPAGTTQHKLVGFGVGPIKGIRDVRLNDLVIDDCPAFKISNTLYSDAMVTKSSSSFIITANSVTKTIDLASFTTVLSLVEEIRGYNNGWVFTDTCFSSNTTSSITDITATNCYNNPVSLMLVGLDGCSYTAYTGDGEQLIDSRVGMSTKTVIDYSEIEGNLVQVGSHEEPVYMSEEEKAKIVGGLKYDAYLAITAKASDKLSSSYNVTALVDGRLVRVYTSLTTYTVQWSDNPAWCELDFKTSIDGCGMDYDNIDLPTYLVAGNYYDELVNGQKRYVLNLIMDERKSRQDWLTEIFSTCRSYPVYQRGLHGILVDKPEPVSQIFTVKPDESIETWWQDNSEDIERLQIEYIDPDYEYTKVLAQADRVQLAGETQQFRNKIPFTKKISIYGITNFPQASREAWFHLNKAQTCPEWIQYTTNKRALNRSIGDIVGIWNPITEVTEEGLTYKRYRIMTMNEPQENRITMTMQEYNPNLYTDQQASVAPVINMVTSSKMDYVPITSLSFPQSSNSTVWTIDHPLNKYPAVYTETNTGINITGKIDYMSKSQLTITFSTAVAGTAYLN